MNTEELTLLTEEQINTLEIFKKCGKNAFVTDFAILLGGYVKNRIYILYSDIIEDKCYYWTKTLSNKFDEALNVDIWGNIYYKIVETDNVAIRPVLLSSSIYNFKNIVRNKSGILEAEYGQYPQQAISNSLSKILENEYQLNSLKITGKTYTTYSRKRNQSDNDFNEQHEEYEYGGKKYIRVIATNLNDNSTVLSNKTKANIGDIVWVEVQPVIWLIDEKDNIAVSKMSIVSGIRFNKIDEQWNGDFENTEINRFLQTNLKKDLFDKTVKLEVITKEQKLEEIKMKVLKMQGK